MQYQVRNSKETHAVELKYNDTLDQGKISSVAKAWNTKKNIKQEEELHLAQILPGPMS